MFTLKFVNTIHEDIIFQSLSEVIQFVHTCCRYKDGRFLWSKFPCMLYKDNFLIWELKDSIKQSFNILINLRD